VWPWRTEALCIGIGQSLVARAVAGRGAAAAPDIAPRGEVSPAGDGATGRLARAAVISGHLAHQWVQQPLPGTRSLSELRSFVHSRARLLLGEGDEWLVAADWHASRAFLCAAVRASDIVDCAAAPSGPAGGRLRMHTTAGAMLRLAPARVRARGWVGLIDLDLLHLIHFDAGSPTFMRTVASPAPGDEVELAEELSRELRRAAAIAALPEAGTLTLVAAAPPRLRACNGLRTEAAGLGIAVEPDLSDAQWCCALAAELTRRSLQ
jgi:hypothetical protein